eukprot:6053421-Amphidinium_carterae.1
MASFSIGCNGLRGMLPESGLQAMRTMSELFMQVSRFAGTLPNRAVAGLGALSVDRNDFEGKM